MKPEEDLKHALTLIPQTAHYYYIMGQAFRFISPSDTTLFLAVASYEKAASLDPRNGKLQNSLLGIYMGLHEEMQSKGKPEPFWLEEAVYKKILEISPNNAYALNNLGFLYAEYGVNLNIAQNYAKERCIWPLKTDIQRQPRRAALKTKIIALQKQNSNRP